MQLAEALSLQLGWRTHSQFTLATSQLGPRTSGRTAGPTVDVAPVSRNNESEQASGDLGLG